MIEKLIENLWKTGGDLARGIFVFGMESRFEFIETAWLIRAYRSEQHPAGWNRNLQVGGRPR
jgi:hypothetical protein